MVYGYVLVIIVATPYLPSLIEWASAKWPTAPLSRVGLGVEISMAGLLIVFAGGLFFCNRQKVLRFVLIAVGAIAAGSMSYSIVSNPYKLTHLPEYAILSALIMRAIKGAKEVSKDFPSPQKPPELERKLTDSATASFHRLIVPFSARSGPKALYFQAALITTVLGVMDELYQGLLARRYFGWYDILLNGLGGILGLTVFWAISGGVSKHNKPL